MLSSSSRWCSWLVLIDTWFRMCNNDAVKPRHTSEEELTDTGLLLRPDLSMISTAVKTHYVVDGKAYITG